MNKLGLGALLICWMLLSLVLVASIIGMTLFVPNGLTQPSTWMVIGRRLVTKIVDS